MSTGYPRLYIGRAAYELKRRVNLPVHQVSKETLDDFISYYSSFNSIKDPLVIEDLAYLPIEAQASMLKFIEDSKLNIILLSSEDNIIQTVLSRMSLIYKIKEKVFSQFIPSSQAEEELDLIDHDTFYLTYVKKQMSLSPITYYYDCMLNGQGKNKNKLLQLLE